MAATDGVEFSEVTASYFVVLTRHYTQRYLGILVPRGSRLSLSVMSVQLASTDVLRSTPDIKQCHVSAPDQ